MTQEQREVIYKLKKSDLEKIISCGKYDEETTKLAWEVLRLRSTPAQSSTGILREMPTQANVSSEINAMLQTETTLKKEVSKTNVPLIIGVLVLIVTIGIAGYMYFFSSKMSLQYAVTDHGDGDFSSDKNGVLTFWTDSSKHSDEVFVTGMEPNSKVTFIIENKGKRALVNPILRVEGIDIMLMSHEYGDFTYLSHIHGAGYYAEAEWSEAVSIQPKFSRRLTLNMSGSHFLKKKAKLKVTIAADNYSAETYSLTATYDADDINYNDDSGFADSYDDYDYDNEDYSVDNSYNDYSESPIENPAYTNLSYENGLLTYDAPDHFRNASQNLVMAVPKGNVICCTEAPDRSANMTISIEKVNSNPIQPEYQQYLNEIGGNVTYKASKETFYAASILKNGLHYYRYCKYKNGYVLRFHFECDETYLDIYSKYIDHIYNSFNLNV